MLDVRLACRAKATPPTTIGLRKIDINMPIHQFGCECEMCNFYETNKVHEILDHRTEIVNRKIQQRIAIREEDPQKVFGHYKTILKYLILPSNKIIVRGLNIFTSEVIFYRDGEATSLYCCREVEEPVIKSAHREKLSIHFIQKILADRRRKYRELIQTFLGKKKVVAQKKPLFGRKKPPKKETKDAVLVRYINGYEQLATQSEINTLLQLRKQDPKWKEIAYIKNFVNVEDLSRILVTKYVEGQIKYEELWKRSKQLMKVYAHNIIKGDREYISDQEEEAFCQALTKESYQVYAQYLTYKLVCYVEQFYDEKITKIAAKFLINELGHGYLEDVFKLEKHSLIKFDWTNATYEKKIDEHQQKVIYSKSVKVDEKIMENAAKIGNLLSQQYDDLKEQYGLLNVVEDDTEEIANNQFFKKLYPDIQQPFSDLLKEPNMTVDRFKKSFLGYKPKKKPIVRPFTCNMIRSLHKITPQLRSASPHQYILGKSRTMSTALSTRSGVKLGQSMYSRHTTTGLGSPRPRN